MTIVFSSWTLGFMFVSKSAHCDHVEVLDDHVRHCEHDQELRLGRSLEAIHSQIF